MASTMTKTLLIELNELNFDFVRYYNSLGLLPSLAALMDHHGVVLTTSEDAYEEIEPWIQWVSAHTGLSFADHGVFRLGDTVNRNLHQIWEHLEDAGLKVGAVSPMNAENRTRDAKFFVPDPWTATRVSGSFLLSRVHDSLKQAVNDNAQSRISLKTIFWMLAGICRYAPLSTLKQYALYTLQARQRSWNKAMVLDLFLSDLFIGEVRRTSPDFASLFLNAGAHIQHHYMFNSAPYKGNQQNPEWYISKNYDPLLDIYSLYDKILGEMRILLPEYRLIIATGLHQDPHSETTFYWRLKDHSKFLKRIGVNFEKIEPRMSRDFLVTCKTPEQAQIAEHRLQTVRSSDGVTLFEIDNRGTDLFVTLTYPNDVSADFAFYVGSERLENLRGEIDFVAIKNGRHNGVGYLIDTSNTDNGDQETMELKTLPDVICKGFGLQWARPHSLAGQAT
jgi:hypothetical protein